MYLINGIRIYEKYEHHQDKYSVKLKQKLELGDSRLGSLQLINMQEYVVITKL